MFILRNAEQLVCVSRSGERRKRGATMRDLAIIPDGALIADDAGRIAWVGPTAELPSVPPGRVW